MSAPTAVVLPEEPLAATPAEALAALKALQPEQYGKLLKYAEFKVWQFGGKVPDTDPEDLFHEILMKTLDGTRTWYPQKTNFFAFLVGSIRSEANTRYKRARGIELTEGIPVPTDLAAQVEARNLLEKMRTSLKSRPHAVEIFDLKCERRGAKEIQQHLGISAQIFAAAAKWIERALKQGKFRR